ncbi:MAG: glycoside hydrolase family 3 C-terminal domain-containing protein [Lachnospiraceae bacterium]|nr:glycoside hydrolase family 3 C-terminal domain-containing protein [Lachnospiraceae bacterium]
MKDFIKLILKWLIAIAIAKVAGYSIFKSVIGMVLLPISLLAVYFLVRLIINRITINKMKNNLGIDAPLLKDENGFSFCDLNKNGKLDIYEDSRRPIEARVEDLLSQMTIEEKAGQMFCPYLSSTNEKALHKKGSPFSAGTVLQTIADKQVSAFSCMGAAKPDVFAKWYNACQKMARRTRLGIPITLGSDPRHHFVGENNPLATLVDNGLSTWPAPIGFGAIADEELTEAFGQIARKELRAIGISFGLHPVADTATEPRWPRIKETFGEDAGLNARLTAAYIRGFQGKEISNQSVACCVKHFPGGGPQKDGDDAHFSFGKEQVYPGGHFDYHLKPFEAAAEAGVCAVMPYYGVPIGLEGIEEVGFNYNRDIITGLLREKMKYNGIVHTDYSIIKDNIIAGIRLPARSWGAEELNAHRRVKKAIDAGIDQLGGEFCSELLVDLVRSGEIPEKRLDESCRRVLSLKFRLGLFDNPFVSVEEALRICNAPDYVKAGEEAMRKSLVLLKNQVLPLKKKVNVYIEGFQKTNILKYANIVNSPKNADFALIHLGFPYRSDRRELLAMMFKGLDLDYTEKQKKHLSAIMNTCPTIVCINMVRPAVIPEIAQQAAGILCEFGAKETIILEAVFGEFSPNGKLPFELPRSMEAVRKQKSDVPFDSEDPLYEYGFGLSYSN